MLITVIVHIPNNCEIKYMLYCIIKGNTKLKYFGLIPLTPSHVLDAYLRTKMIDPWRNTEGVYLSLAIMKIIILQYAMFRTLRLTLLKISSNMIKVLDEII